MNYCGIINFFLFIIYAQRKEAVKGKEKIEEEPESCDSSNLGDNHKIERTFKRLLSKLWHRKIRVLGHFPLIVSLEGFFM